MPVSYLSLLKVPVPLKNTATRRCLTCTDSLTLYGCHFVARFVLQKGQKFFSVRRNFYAIGESNVLKIDAKAAVHVGGTLYLLCTCTKQYMYCTCRLAS